MLSFCHEAEVKQMGVKNIGIKMSILKLHVQLFDPILTYLLTYLLTYSKVQSAS